MKQTADRMKDRSGSCPTPGPTPGPTKTEVLGSVDHKLGVVVDEASTGGIALEGGILRSGPASSETAEMGVPTYLG